MENAAKALEIATGVLLAVIIVSLIVYFFATISEWPQQEDDMQTAEQLAQFNLEYEVYEKDAMYGVDVISCLNKAHSNNQKYVEGTAGFLSGNVFGPDFTVDVYVRINTPLKENIEIYYFNEDLNTEEQRRENDLKSPTSKTLKELNLEQLAGGYYTMYKETDPLWSKPNDLIGQNYISADGGSHKITLEDGTEKNYYSIEDEVFVRLLEFASKDFKITKKNTDSRTFRDWSTVVWETALYNFKTRRFTCDGIKYNDTTGRVSEIYFSEK